MRSSVTLPLLEQQVHDVEADFQGLRQWSAVERRRARWRLANPERAVPDWDDVRDRGLAIKYGDGLATANRAKVLAKMRFKFRDSHLLHALMMTIPGSVGKESCAGAV